MGERFLCTQPLAVVARLALAQQQQAHVGQRRQVAGRTDRAFEWNVRIDFGVHQRHQMLQHHAAHAGKAARQAVDFQQHNQAHGGIVQRFADTGGMAQHDGALQLFQIFAGDAGGGQQTEAGVDAVNRTVFFDNAVDAGDAVINGCVGLVGQRDVHRFVISAAQFGKCQMAGMNGDGKHDASFFLCRLILSVFRQACLKKPCS